MKNTWDERYSAKEYIYGRNPNSFFKSTLDPMEAGKLLLPGEGEGRNAVYAASRGWETDAFDISTKGKEKALQLAKEEDVDIHYLVSTYMDFNPENIPYDLIGLFYTHQPATSRKEFHRKLIEWLRPGGTLVLEGFHKEQINRNSGGPKSEEFLYSEEELTEDFMGLHITSLEKMETTLDEGNYHQGKAIVIRLTGKKLF